MLKKIREKYEYDQIDWKYFNEKRESRNFTGEITKMYEYFNKQGDLRYGILFQETTTTLLIDEEKYYMFLGRFETLRKDRKVNALIQGIPHYCSFRNCIVVDRSVLITIG